MKTKKPQHRDVLFVGGLKFKKGETALDSNCWVRMAGTTKLVLFYTPAHSKECEYGCCADNRTKAHWNARALVELSRKRGRKLRHRTPEGRVLYMSDDVKSEWITKEAKTYGAAYRQLINHIELLSDKLLDLQLDLRGEHAKTRAAARARRVRSV